MHITLAAALFIVFYVIQLLLCLLVKNWYVKLIPAYVGIAGVVFALLLYMEIFGNLSMGMLGNGHILAAIILLIAMAILFAALLLAYVTYRIVCRRRAG